MFTGIISAKTKVLGTTDLLGNKKVTFALPEGANLEKGESVSIEGVCSTIINLEDDKFTVEYMNETLGKTTLGALVAGSEVNFEERLKAGDKISGHFVYGHIDGIGVIEKVVKGEGSTVFTLNTDSSVAKYIAYKGSICLAGVSLTVSKVKGTRFEVSLIPYTREHTTLGEKKVGDILNIETDIIARYAERLGEKFE